MRCTRLAAEWTEKGERRLFFSFFSFSGVDPLQLHSHTRNSTQVNADTNVIDGWRGVQWGMGKKDQRVFAWKSRRNSIRLAHFSHPRCRISAPLRPPVSPLQHHQLRARVLLRARQRVRTR